MHNKQVRARPILATRSRPYYSHDNVPVEQQNWRWPRQLLSCGRLEAQGLLAPTNTLYAEAWGPLQNFFLPSMKRVRKWREGRRWARRELRDRYEALDPFVLAAEVERRLKPILGAALAV